MTCGDGGGVPSVLGTRRATRDARLAGCAGRQTTTPARERPRRVSRGTSVVCVWRRGRSIVGSSGAPRCAAAPPPPSHTAMSPSTPIGSTPMIFSIALDRIAPPAYGMFLTISVENERDERPTRAAIRIMGHAEQALRENSRSNQLNLIEFPWQPIGTI